MNYNTSRVLFYAPRSYALTRLGPGTVEEFSKTIAYVQMRIFGRRSTDARRTVWPFFVRIVTLRIAPYIQYSRVG